MSGQEKSVRPACKCRDTRHRIANWRPIPSAVRLLTIAVGWRRMFTNHAQSSAIVMDTPQPAPPSTSVVRSRLRDAAGLVRDSDSLDANVRETLSALLDELGRALESPEVPPAEVAHLAESATHLAE